MQHNLKCKILIFHNIKCYMFNELIERFGSNLGLSPEQAIKSELVIKLCSDLIHGQVVVTNSNQNKSMDLNFNIKKIDQNFTKALNGPER